MWGEFGTDIYLVEAIIILLLCEWRALHIINWQADDTTSVSAASSMDVGHIAPQENSANFHFIGTCMWHVERQVPMTILNVYSHIPPTTCCMYVVVCIFNRIQPCETAESHSYLRREACEPETGAPSTYIIPCISLYIHIYVNGFRRTYWYWLCTTINKNLKPSQHGL